MSRFALFVFSITLLSAAPQAQAGPSGGPTLALAQGFSVDPSTPLPGLTAASVVQTRTDLDAGPPTPWLPSPGQPDFSALPIPSTLDVDALSLGLDWIPSDGLGFAVVPPGNWAAMTWSVRRSTLGAPGSAIAAEVGAPGGAAGDVFAYVFPGSALPPPIVGIPFRAQDGTEIAVSTPALPGNLNAHDLYLGLIYRENPQLAALLPPPTVYFSVTAATAAFLPPAWAPLPLRSGATVFATTWNPLTATWSPVTVAIDPAMLGITAGEDLDALAVDLMHGRVVFSTDPALPPPLPMPPRAVLLYSNYGSGSHVEYRLPGGTPVSTAVGLGSSPDDIDGICFVDPGGPGGPSQIRLDRMLGTPGFPVAPSAPTTLQASVARRFDPSTGHEFAVTMMTGWPPPGTPTTGFAIVALTIGPPAAGPWVSAGLYTRPNPGSPYVVFQGHPERHEFHIPPVFSLSNVPLSFVWAAFSATSFALSLPVTLTL